MTLRILFTLAILAGLAAAPTAQTPGPQRGSRAGVEMFRWEAGGRNDAGTCVERALEQARRNVSRTWERIERSVQRAITQRERAENRRAARASTSRPATAASRSRSPTTTTPSSKPAPSTAD